jgi:hypothetical protein
VDLFVICEVVQAGQTTLVDSYLACV